MTDWTTIANSQVEPKAPVTSELLTSLRDNPIAIAEGTSGAPTMEVAWHQLEFLNPTTDAVGFTFSTLSAEYRALMVVGIIGTASAGAHRVEFLIGSNWYSAVEDNALSSAKLLVHAVVYDADGDSGSSLKPGFASIRDGTGTLAPSSSDIISGLFTIPDSGAITRVRVQNDTGNLDASDTDGIWLFGIKRTQP